MTDLSQIAADFAVKRRAFLDAHESDFQSVATAATYDASEDALDLLMDALRDALQRRPEAMVALIAAETAT